MRCLLVTSTAGQGALFPKFDDVKDVRVFNNLFTVQFCFQMLLIAAIVQQVLLELE